MDLSLHVTSGGPTAVGAVLRSNQAYLELLSTKTTLDWGIVFHCDRYPDLLVGNQFREVWIDTVEVAGKALRAVEAFFGERDMVCTRWALAEAQPPEPVVPLLTAAGFQRADSLAMALPSWPDLAPPANVRILPARPMRAAFRESWLDATGHLDEKERDATVEAANERLNDHRMDAFVAMIAKAPAGTCTLFQVGDIARIVDFHVVRRFRRRGVGTALLDGAITLARRLAVRIVCLEVPAGDAGVIGTLRKFGFVEAGRMIQFCRPGDAHAVCER